MNRFRWLILCAFVVAVSCKDAKKNEPIGIDKMKLITWDLIKAGEWHLQVIAKDSAALKRKEETRYYAQVFAIHGVTREQYYKSYRYYEAHPTEFKVLIDSIDAFSNREKNRLFENHGQAR